MNAVTGKCFGRYEINWLKRNKNEKGVLIWLSYLFVEQDEASRAGWNLSL